MSQLNLEVLHAGDPIREVGALGLALLDEVGLRDLAAALNLKNPPSILIRNQNPDCAIRDMLL